MSAKACWACGQSTDKGRTGSMNLLQCACCGAVILRGVHPNFIRDHAQALTPATDAVRVALENIVAHEVDYMKRNNLGDPEKQSYIIQARAALASPQPSTPSADRNTEAKLRRALKKCKALTDPKESECGFDECEKVFIICREALAAPSGDSRD